MTHVLSVDAVFVTILGHPLSYIELVGTLLYVWSVWLVGQRSMLTWPVGIVSVLLYMCLFYQIRLYSDALEQVYYLVAGAYGWWYWSRSRIRTATMVDVSFSPARTALIWLAATAASGAVLGWLMSRIHVWAPAVVPNAAAYPNIDALTTVMSLTAMWLMARRHVESWLYWIVVDVAGIALYFVQNVKFVSLLYVILLGLAIRGLRAWGRDAGYSARSASDG